MGWESHPDLGHQDTTYHDTFGEHRDFEAAPPEKVMREYDKAQARSDRSKAALDDVANAYPRNKREEASGQRFLTTPVEKRFSTYLNRFGEDEIARSEVLDAAKRYAVKRGGEMYDQAKVEAEAAGHKIDSGPIPEPEPYSGATIPSLSPHAAAEVSNLAGQGDAAAQDIVEKERV